MFFICLSASGPFRPRAVRTRRIVARLRALLRPDALLYAVRRFHDPDCDWLVCDFFRIDGPDVACLTRDVAIAIGRFDPEREVGVKLHRPFGADDPLRAAIEDRLSLALFGAPGRLSVRTIG